MPSRKEHIQDLRERRIKDKGQLTVSEARRLLHYDPDTGIFMWKVTRSGKAKAGMLAGRVMQNGYLIVMVHEKAYLGHRLAWFIYYGRWPVGFIDHANGKPLDNRISNLRECTNSENQANRHKTNNRTSGVKGVCFDKRTGKWQAAIKVNGRNKYLGQYDTIKKAEAAYKKSAKEAFGEFSN